MRSVTLARFLCLLLATAFCFGQAAAPSTPAPVPDKAEAYYRYSLGHLYSELAGAYGNRGDYFNKAVENYRAAMKADPAASFISEELSDLYIQSGRLREAVSEAEDAIKRDPDDLNARRVLARIYARLIGDPQQNRLDENMLKKAIEQYQKIADTANADLDSLLMLGRLQKIAQNSVESEKAFKRALAIDPDNEDAMGGLAAVYMDLGDNKAAADLLRKQAEKSPTARSLTALANAYEQMKEFSLAAETLRRALEESPDNAAELKKAMAQDLLLSDQFDAALKTYGELAAEDPKDVQPQLRISQIYREQRKFDKAREAADKAKEIDPTNIEVRYNEVSLLQSEGKLASAISVLKEILHSTEKKTYNASERGNRAVLLERLGVLYRDNEQFEPAAETFRQIAQLDPDLGARAATQVIETYRAGKEFTKAEEESAAAVKKYPSDRMVKTVRATLLADLGKADQAVAEVRSLLNGKNDRETYVTLAQIYEKTKNYDEMGKALDAAGKLATTKDENETIYFMRGALLEHLKKFEAAEAEFRKVLEIDPDNASALNYVGYMLADRDVRLPEAHDMITKALVREPNNGAFLDSLGWVYFRMNRFPEAEENLRRSLQLMPRDPTVHDHLGDVYFHQGKILEAMTQWQRSLKEWNAGAPGDLDPAEVAKVQKKVEDARVRLAKESGAPR